MANHVNTRINVNCNDEALELLSTWMDTVASSNDPNKPATLIRDDFDPETGADFSWYIENIGSKWCVIEDVSADSMFIHTTSAWDWPNALCEWIYDKLSSIDPDAELHVEYEDEMPNFIGVHHYGPTGDIGKTISNDELIEFMEIPEGLEEDEEWEYIQENIYDVMEEWFQNNG